MEERLGTVGERYQIINLHFLFYQGLTFHIFQQFFFIILLIKFLMSFMSIKNTSPVSGARPFRLRDHEVRSRMRA